MGASFLGVAHPQRFLGHRKPAEEEPVVPLQLVDQSLQNGAETDHPDVVLLSRGVPGKGVVHHDASL